MCVEFVSNFYPSLPHLTFCTLLRLGTVRAWSSGRAGRLGSKWWPCSTLLHWWRWRRVQSSLCWATSWNSRWGYIQIQHNALTWQSRQGKAMPWFSVMLFSVRYITGASHHSNIHRSLGQPNFSVLIIPLSQQCVWMYITDWYVRLSVSPGFWVWFPAGHCWVLSWFVKTRYV